MLEDFKSHFNETRTQNDAVAYKSTNSKVLDLFSMGGAFRQRSDSEIAELFSKAFAEDSLLAMKTLFYLRDIRGGQGERRFFRVALKHLALNNKESLRKNLHLIPEFGRWDDMWVLLDTNLKNDVIRLVGKQLIKDRKSDNPSLLAKWLPSENASSKETKRYAKIIRVGLGGTARKYRKLLSSLRKKINIVETKLTNKDYKSIDYSKIPSRAGLIYRGAFARNDHDRYNEFLEKLEKGEVKVNVDTLYPYDIVHTALKGYDGKNVWGWGGKSVTEEEIRLLDSQWKSLPDYTNGSTENCIAVVDTSGSMNGTPMEVAISLGIYLAERNKGVFHNHFFTFSNNPQLKEVVGSNIVDKVRNLSDSDWGMSTNIEAVFREILNIAIKSNTPKEEMIKKVVIISDMQFNQATYEDEHIFKIMEEEFANAGYDIPLLTFWNVNAFKTNTQFTMNEEGVELVSGFSPVLFEYVLNSISKTPYELMLEVVNSERYSDISV